MAQFSRAAFDALVSEGLTRAWDGLGGSHTLVTYPPLDALDTCSPEIVLPRIAQAQDVNLYVHIPFCEMRCAFCPYETHAGTAPGVIDAYLQALAKEIGLLSNTLHPARVRSLYIGGGTATVLAPAQLERLMAALRARFPFDSNTLICVETSPNALIHDASKIAMLRQLGVRRISVGVQTFSETTLHAEGRTHDPAQTSELLAALIGEFDIVNIDLMQDMPGQTDEHLANDIEQIAKLKPAQVTWYVERLRKWQGSYPDSYLSVRRRLWIRDEMRRFSYQARPGGRFLRTGIGDDVFKSIRCGLTSHLVGVGPSAYSHVPGHFYRNIVDTAQYTAAVLAGNLPIATGAAIRDLDSVAARLVSGIRWGVRLDDADPQFASYTREAKRRLGILIRHGLVRFDEASEEYAITLDDLGWGYEEEICSLFVPDDVVERIRAKNLPWWLPNASKVALQSTLAVLWFAQSVEALSVLL
jgi:coproporphyrinogen III oxidase-like Fe-S oxidoreductase